MSQEKPDYDSPWKVVLDRYFESFLEFFFPDVWEDVDWSHPPEDLNQEFPPLKPDAETPGARVDKLYRVKLKQPYTGMVGTASDVLFLDVLSHVEIQANWDGGLEERVFIYSYRSYDQHRRPVITLVILADVKNPHWRPNSYGWNVHSEMGIRFPAVKLLDYTKDWEALEASKNPFAPVVMAHLKAKETVGDDESRLRWKLRVTRHLLEMGVSKQEILDVFRFIDWVMRLPPELSKQFKKEISTTNATEETMEYISSFERLAMEEGREAGLEEGLKEGLRKGEEAGLKAGREEGRLRQMGMLRRQMERRFGDLPSWAVERLERASVDQLDRWAVRLLAVDRLEDLFDGE